MSTIQQKAMIAGFTTAERDYIRRNLDQFFSTLPTVADDFLLRGLSPPSYRACLARD
jgi:hypothetical protein